MEYKLIDEYFNALNLRKPNLNVLRPDAQFYTSLLLQPSGEIAYGNDFIRFADIPTSVRKFTSFFNLAIQNNIDLAITPEYSCPWAVISNLLNTNNLPNEGSLWVVGCQSIKAEEIANLMAAHTDITWIVENDLIEANRNNQLFFDPVCYIFKSRATNNTIRTVIIIQFKTHFLGGGAMEWERDNFIQGSRIYVLENNANNSCRLLTLICSDTLSPDLNNLDHQHFANSPYLIIHIQLNQAPNHDNYSQYRRIIYGMGRENKEFLCLNWARNIIIDRNPWNNYGGSALYLKPEKKEDINLSDNRLNANQKLGMYYTRWVNKYAHIFLLNYEEHIFQYRNTKPAQTSADPATRKRTGPEMLNTFSWDTDNNSWSPLTSVDGGLRQTCLSLNNDRDYNFLLNKSSITPIDGERLLYLSNGKAIDKDWFKPQNITFLHIKDDEIDKRMTFTQNPCPLTLLDRRRLLLQYATLEYAIISNPELLPHIISDLANNCVINYRLVEYESEYNLNIYPANTIGVPASGAFIGQATHDDALSILNKMISLFTTDQYGKRTVVWYIDCNLQTQVIFKNDKPKFTENTSRSANSIKSIKRK